VEGAGLHIAVASVSASAEIASEVRLVGALESVGDPYPVLRKVWDNVSPDGSLTVSYGAGGSFKLSDEDVALLLTLASFRPGPARSMPTGREMTGVRLHRNTRSLSCTVVVPCRNEVDNVANLIDRLPEIGTHTELIFVDGASNDGTPERIEQLIKTHAERDIKLLRQAGNTGKAGATFQGFAAAQGDTAMILDADMTVRPEDLPRFHNALAEGVTDFANGTRLMFPMASGAMPGLNNAGNRFFSRYMSWLVNARITDTLCGTKAAKTADIAQIIRLRPLFGGHDPWGDFDLIMGAAYAGLRIMDVPVRYEARTAGESKMRPFNHGLSLAQTCLSGARRLKLSR
jgi:hypothetical protein